MIIRKITILTLLVFLCATSCKKYLQVNPKSTTSQEDLFATEEGFFQALNGIYANLASQKLYGDNLTMGYASALGQNYIYNNAGFVFKETMAYNYSASECRGYATSIWLTAYNSIASLNNLLAYIDSKKNEFTDNNYAIIKGEALGIRAYLHFDLLRYFGPYYSATSSVKTIPYKTSFNALTTSAIPAKSVMDSVFKDIKDAEALLKDIDPINQKEMNRRFHMNYLALLGLEARAYLYMGDKTNAAIAANAVVNSGKFQFTTLDKINTSPNSKDRLFSKELVMALRVRDIAKWATQKGYFYATGQGHFYCYGYIISWQQMFEVLGAGANDYRYKYLFENSSFSVMTYMFPSKFWQTWSGSTSGGPADSNRLDQMVPMIRLSEMYYILAETAATPEEGAAYLNKVRVSRGVTALNTTGITDQTLQDEIRKEYVKEFYAEGQTFLYYKRKATTVITSVASLTPPPPMTEIKYTIPVPELESELNN